MNTPSSPAPAPSPSPAPGPPLAWGEPGVRPTVPGWYWCCLWGDPDRKWVDHVWERDGGLFVDDTEDPDTSVPIGSRAMDHFRWAGPLPEPAEPGQAPPAPPPEGEECWVVVNKYGRWLEAFFSNDRETAELERESWDRFAVDDGPHVVRRARLVIEGEPPALRPIVPPPPLIRRDGHRLVVGNVAFDREQAEALLADLRHVVDGLPDLDRRLAGLTACDACEGHGEVTHVDSGNGRTCAACEGSGCVPRPESDI